MADSKPQITATIRFRGVTIEGMTITELKELRDMLDTLVGKEKEYIPYPQPYPVYPAYPWYSPNHLWVSTSSNTSGGTLPSNTVHYTLSCCN